MGKLENQELPRFSKMNMRWMTAYVAKKREKEPKT
jgi:hypothetical protein